MQKIITSTLHLMIISIPLIFTTINYELFEFPKFILLLTVTIIITIAWAIDAYHTKLKGSSPKLSPISTGILLVLATQALATIFSIDPHTSFWGYYSRFHQGLLTTICYTLIYFASLQYLDNKSTHKLIKISIATAILISLYAIAQRFGIDKSLWVQDVVNRPFSTLGQPNWLAAYLLPHIFLTLYLHSTNHNKLPSPISRIVHYLLFTILFTALLLTKSRSGLLAFSLSYITYWALLARNLTLKKIKNPLITFSVLTLIITLIIRSPFSISASPLPPQGTQLESGGTESGDIRKIVWTGALDLIRENPLLGTGPETFAYSYYWTRPIEHNQTSEWDFLYNKSHNEYLNIAATTGLVGLAGYLYWHFAILRLSLTKIKKSRAFYPVLAASIASFSITNFFGFSVIPVYLVMITLSALPATIANKPAKLKHTPSSHWLLLITASGILIIIFPLRLFLSDLSFAKGKAHLSAANLTTAQDHLERAITLRPSEPLYHSFLAELYAQLAVTTTEGNYHQLALNEIQYTQDHNPWHLNYAKSRTKAWLSLAQLDPTLHETAAIELEHARELAPTDPKLAYNLGLIYSRLNQADKAIQQMIDAINLKPDYYQPYYALTLLYETTKQLDLIPPLLEKASTHISPLPEPLAKKLDLYSTN